MYPAHMFYVFNFSSLYTATGLCAMFIMVLRGEMDGRQAALTVK